MLTFQYIIVIPAVFAFALITALLVYLAIKAHQRKVETGNEGLVGERGDYRGGGTAFVHGELWKVLSNDNLAEGDGVVVEGVERMILRVRKTEQA